MAVLAVAWTAAYAQGNPDADSPTGATGGRPVYDDVLRFRNGDVLSATFVGMNADGALQFEHADAPEPFAVDPSRVHTLLPVRPPRPPAAERRHVVELVNGDRLAGDVEALNDSVLRLDTEYSGSLELKRAMVRRITSQTAFDDAVYSGPSGMLGWCLIPPGDLNRWQYRDGAFHATRPNSGSLSRFVPLPPVASIEFDLAWQETPQLFMGLYLNSIDGNQMGGGGYTLTMNGAQWQLKSRVPGSQSPTGGDGDASRFLNRKQAHVAIMANLPGKQMAVCMDGEVVKQWTLPGDVTSHGAGLLFNSGLVAGSNGADRIAIGNILIRRWNGKLGNEDSVILANGDQINGVLKRMTGTGAIVASGASETNIPADRIMEVVLARTQAATPPPLGNEIFVKFRRGGGLTLALQKADGRALSGISAACGPVTVPLDALSLVQFHSGDRNPAGAGNPGVSPAEPDLAQWVSGDRMHGTLDGFEGDRLKWSRADFKPFPSSPLNRLLELQLAPKGTRQPARRQTVALVNGDQLEGNIVSLNNSTLRLDTVYAGVLDLNRKVIRRIVNRSALFDVIYAGPTGPDEWTTVGDPEESGWRYRDGAFITTYRFGGCIRREIDLPDKATIEFDLAYMLSPFVGVAFLAENFQGDDYTRCINGSLLQLYISQCYLYVGKGGAIPTILKSPDIGPLLTCQPVHIAIGVDRSGGRVFLFINNVPVKLGPASFEILGAELGSGRNLCFVTKRTQSGSRVSNIVVRRGLPIEAEITPGSQAGDRIFFANGENLDGTLTIADGKATIVPAGAEAIVLPLDRLLGVDFTKSTSVVPATSNIVRVAFADGSRLTLAAWKPAGRALTGMVQDSGPATVSLETAIRLQFRSGDAQSVKQDANWSKPAPGDMLIGPKQP